MATCQENKHLRRMTNLVCTFHRDFTDIEISSVQRRAREQNNVHEKNALYIIYSSHSP